MTYTTDVIAYSVYNQCLKTIDATKYVGLAKLKITNLCSCVAYPLLQQLLHYSYQDKKLSLIPDPHSEECKNVRMIPYSPFIMIRFNKWAIFIESESDITVYIMENELDIQTEALVAKFTNMDEVVYHITQ